MSITPPPWKLYGWAGLLVDWIAFERVKEALLPEGFSKASFFRADTLAGHYFGSYRPADDSTFREPFHEFGFIPAIARCGKAQGYALARMAVDHPGAIEGGQQHWGIEKVPGEFKETGDYGMSVVSEGGRLNISVEFRKRFSLGYWNKAFTFINRRHGQVIQYQVRYHGQLYFCKAVTNHIHHNGRVFPLLFDNCTITIEAPSVVEE